MWGDIRVEEKLASEGQVREVKEAAGQGQDPGFGVWRAVSAPSAACIPGGQVRKQKGRD